MHICTWTTHCYTATENYKIMSFTATWLKLGDILNYDSMIKKEKKRKQKKREKNTGWFHLSVIYKLNSREKYNIAKDVCPEHLWS